MERLRMPANVTELKELAKEAKISPEVYLRCLTMQVGVVDVAKMYVGIKNKQEENAGNKNVGNEST
jgi:hypothetical protein